MLELILAIPAFARMYNVSCKLCHVAYPKLNAFGEGFADNGYVFPGQQENIYRNLNDEDARTFKELPLAVRFTQYVTAKYDSAGIFTDFQTPWATKLLMGGALTENVNFYSYVIFEKGLAPFFEDAWVDLHGFFGLPFSLTLGQFQISDLMFMRETRLTRSDFYIYKVGPYPLTYHRGAILGTPIGDFGVVNGNGAHGSINGFYDNNSQKWYFAHFSLPFDFGLFGMWGEDYDTLDGYVSIYRLGIDWRGHFGNLHPFAQIIVGYDKDTSNLFYGGFLGIDYAAWPNVFAFLFNYVDAPSNSSYYSQRMLTVAGRYSRYVLTNLKVFAELEAHFRARSHYLTLGVDFAF
ncbi:MAG: hypothetical protein GXO39_09150 [Thermotogae bacterium]|nr:hypothetical protein [Thermotogota bacterium]